VKTDRGWKRCFDAPIPLPRGRYLVTLEDAGNYITKLPKAEHEAADAVLSVVWQNRKIWLKPLVALLLIAVAVMFVAVRGPLPIPRLKV
jgi:hypothetical protein